MTQLFLLQQATPGGGGSPSLFGVPFFFIQIALIFVVFYFFFIRPQSTARKKHAELLSQLKTGDEVTTAGGLIGRVKALKDDRVTIESGTATVVVERARIVRVGSSTAPGAS